MKIKEKKERKVSPQLALLVFRIANGILTRTFFQPDEFWQALEPAHLMAFGYGELTWEWKYGLRSYAFPLLFEITYRFVRITALSIGFSLQMITDAATSLIILTCPENNLKWKLTNHLSRIPYQISEVIEYYGVIYAPKVVMAVIAAVGEYYLVLLVQKIYILTRDKTKNTKKAIPLSKITKFTMMLTLTNFFNCFLITRSFINSFEMALTCIALFYWDWNGGEHIHTTAFTKSIAVAIFTCFQRPSNALIWIILGGFLVFNLSVKHRFSEIRYLFYKISLIAIGVSIVNTMIDFYFYRKLAFPLLSFLKFNFTSPLSRFYGVAPWHFHIAQSLPLMLGYSLPLFSYGMITTLSKKEFSSFFLNPLIQCKFVIVVNLVAYSSLPHKEFRFIYPLQPFFILISSLVLLELSDRYTVKSAIVRGILWCVPLFSVFGALLLCSFHEAGTIAVMKFLHNQPQIDSLGFIMPCHSTPWQSYLHRNDTNDLWAITCDPPLHLLDDAEVDKKLVKYMDESDYLYANIPKFIYQNFPPTFRKELRSPEKVYKHEWPEYLVIFKHLEDAYLANYLRDSSYVEITRFFNSLSHWDHRRNGDVVVYQKILK